MNTFPFNWWYDGQTEDLRQFLVDTGKVTSQKIADAMSPDDLTREFVDREYATMIYAVSAKDLDWQCPEEEILVIKHSEIDKLVKEGKAAWIHR